MLWAQTQRLKDSVWWNVKEKQEKQNAVIQNSRTSGGSSDSDLTRSRYRQEERNGGLITRPEWSGADLHHWLVLFCNVDCWLEPEGNGLHIQRGEREPEPGPESLLSAGFSQRLMFGSDGRCRSDVDGRRVVLFALRLRSWPGGSDHMRCFLLLWWNFLWFKHCWEHLDNISTKAVKFNALITC